MNDDVSATTSSLERPEKEAFSIGGYSAGGVIGADDAIWKYNIVLSLVVNIKAYIIFFSSNLT